VWSRHVPPNLSRSPDDGAACGDKPVISAPQKLNVQRIVVINAPHFNHSKWNVKPIVKDRELPCVQTQLHRQPQRIAVVVKRVPRNEYIFSTWTPVTDATILRGVIQSRRLRSELQ
jgi:hypothetical protein